MVWVDLSLSNIEELRIAMITELGTEDAVREFLNQLINTDWKAYDDAYARCPCCSKKVGRQNIIYESHLPSSFTKSERQFCKNCLQDLRSLMPYDCIFCKSWYGNAIDSPNEFRACGDCLSLYSKEIKQVKSQQDRAKKNNVIYTLSLLEWIMTLQHFEYKCAYCRDKKYECSEHYLPINLGGGTSQGNMLPACISCNTRKRDRHPDALDGLFPVENLARIREYLALQRKEAA